MNTSGLDRNNDSQNAAKDNTTSFQKKSTGSNPIHIQSPSIALPKGGGAIRGIGETFQPDPFSGAASYSIPIPFTTARGFEPQLSIDYSSGSGNDIFGMGFSIAIPAISVRTGKGIPQYNGTDIYMWNGIELILKKDTSSKTDDDWAVFEYLPRIQSDFALIQQFVKADGSESYWTITTNDNTVSVFGSSNESRIYNPANTSQIFKWLIDQSTDAKGNKNAYTYKAENNDNVPTKPWEQNRSYNNKYIQKVQYGNYTDQLGKELFAYELIFDYGEYVLPSLDESNNPFRKLIVDPHQPINKWKYRDDPFSTYTCGFEIRTCRLCYNVMLFHCFENELGNPCLVKNLHLEYKQSNSYNDRDHPGLSLLAVARLTGYRRLGKTALDNYDIQKTPPVEFNFSAFNPPLEPLFQQIEVDEGNIPGYLNNAGFQLIDLHGEGIAGLLYSNHDSIYYCSPEGEGQYDLPAFPFLFPTDRNFADGSVSLIDLDSDGMLDLVVGESQRNGYYLKKDDSWQNYLPFQSFPTNISGDGIEMADVNNNGKVDAVIVGNNHISVYPSLGTGGFGPLITAKKEPDFPSVKKGYQEQYVGFADMIGDGLSHRVKISQGSVECWPDMGYGVFGKKVTFGNPPFFGNGFDINRLFLTDIDGSGTSDIVYVDQDKVTVYINQSGNFFSDGITIDLPKPYSAIDQVSFSDIKGNGTNCLVYTIAGSKMQHYYYDFVGETIIDGEPQKSMKPYLLIEVGNNLGISNRIQYCSSTKFYLEDKKSGNPWCTRLPFPVQVIEKLSVIDKINNACYTSRFKFHDGHYDSMEREFIGFGYVETWDTETYEQISQQSKYKVVNRKNYVPPVYARTWYYTGADFNNPAVMENYKAHFFNGDINAYDFPDAVFEESIYKQDSDTLRQAYLSLKGRVLRTEVYADDKEINPLLYQNPYTVTQANAKVFLYQEKGDQPYAVFLVVPRESISYNYERIPEDPRVQQSFTLVTDSFGNTIESCVVYLERRPNNTPFFVKYPEQYTVRASLLYQKFANAVQGFLFCNIPCEEQNFEVAGLQPGTNGYFSFEGMKKQIDLIGLPNRSNIVPYGGNFTSGVQARQVSWKKQYYWNWSDPHSDPVLGVVSSPSLIHHEESAVFTSEFTIDVFDGRLIDAAAYTGEGYLHNVIYTYGGYFYSSTDGYWWNKGLVQYYLPPSIALNSPNSFYMPCKTENSFAKDPIIGKNGKSFTQDSSLNETTSIFYDDYYLFPVKLIQEIDDSLSNTLYATMDYISAQPKQLIDINNNTSQVLYDPLGQVIVSSLFGYENGVKTGGMTLYDNGLTKAEYQDPGEGSFMEVINNPEKFLQGACTYFFYNLNAWMDSKQPVCSINLVRNNYWHSATSDSLPYCQVLINYTDGLGRDIEKKMYAGITSNRIANVVSEKWQVTGRTVYNNKEQPCEQYLPYFTSFPGYEDQKNIPGPPPAVTHYDPLSRVIRIDTPKRFFSKVEFTPWEEMRYDENDTILDSYFYQNEYPGNLTPNEIDAIKKAIKFYNTPSVTIIDNKGSVFLEIKNNLGNVPKDAFKSLESNPGISSAAIWNNLYANGYLSQYPDFPSLDLNFLTAKFQPYTPGFVLQLDAKYSGILQQILDILKENCLTSHYTTDIMDNIVESIDPRIYYNNIISNTTGYNFRYKYAMGEDDPVFIDSIDAGSENPAIKSYAEKHLSNIFGSQLWTWTPRSYCQFVLYDRLQRKTALKVKKIITPGPVTDYDDFNIVEIFTYGESVKSVDGYNLRGQVYQVNDLSGIVINSSYTMLGQPLSTSRQMLTDYKNAADWKDMLPLLGETVYLVTFTYNSLRQMLSQTTPDRAVTTNTYDQAGLLKTISVKFPDNNPAQPIVENIEYDAKGQRTLVKNGNGITTNYGYEETTLRLISLKSTRPVGYNPAVIQDVEYYYDPVGNITRTLDNTAKIIFCNNQRIEPLLDYSYNAIYKLIVASGRQHTGINANTYRNNSPDSFKQCFFGPPPFVADSNKLENYTANYTYDDSGNLINIKHTASSNTSWSRDLSVADNSNRLKNHVYDASGNLRELDVSNSIDLSFNCCENLVKAGVIKRPDKPDDCDYYMYDSSEGRTRKVSEKLTQGGSVTVVEDNIYVGNFSTKKKISVSTGGTASLISERYTLRIMDDQRCIAIIYYTPSDTSKPEMEGLRQYRFQLDNNIGSVCLEMDISAQLISYEEYFPYGGTAIITGTIEAEVKLKEYRYSGKECDDTTGLYYYGSRYYVSWQGRWLNPDPAGTVDGMNLFAFVGGNPITHDDNNGLMKRSRRMAGLDPENEGMEDTVRKSGGDMLSMRAKPNTNGTPTQGYTATDKSYKTSLRLHWKGYMDPSGESTGIVPYLTTRDSKGWTVEHNTSTQSLSKRLRSNTDYTPLDNGSSTWAAENSHIIAGSLWGPNDVLSAPPAGVHQNTEWLAIETGIKSLVSNAGLGSQLRIKATGYVNETGPGKGWLKSARYKIYINNTKVFDHVSMGERGNIDIDEAKALRDKVKNLSVLSPAVSLLGGAPKNTISSFLAPPSLSALKKNRTESASSPMFTGLSTNSGYKTGVNAFNYMTKMYQ